MHLYQGVLDGVPCGVLDTPGLVAGQPGVEELNFVKQLLARAGAKEVRLLKTHTPYLTVVISSQGATEVPLITPECT